MTIVCIGLNNIHCHYEIYWVVHFEHYSDVGWGLHILYMICVDHRKLEIAWTNCVGFASDNCNTLIGVTNMVLSRVHERQPHVYSLGCICHLAGLCVKAGMKQWSLPVDDLLIDEWFHFVHRYTISSTICCPHLYWFNKFN